MLWINVEGVSGCLVRISETCNRSCMKHGVNWLSVVVSIIAIVIVLLWEDLRSLRDG